MPTQALALQLLATRAHGTSAQYRQSLQVGSWTCLLGKHCWASGCLPAAALLPAAFAFAFFAAPFLACGAEAAIFAAAGAFTCLLTFRRRFTWPPHSPVKQRLPFQLLLSQPLLPWCPPARRTCAPKHWRPPSGLLPSSTDHPSVFAVSTSASAAAAAAGTGDTCRLHTAVGRLCSLLIL